MRCDEDERCTGLQPTVAFPHIHARAPAQTGGVRQAESDDNTHHARRWTPCPPFPQASSRRRGRQPARPRTGSDRTRPRCCRGPRRRGRPCSSRWHKPSLLGAAETPFALPDTGPTLVLPESRNPLDFDSPELENGLFGGVERDPASRTQNFRAPP